MALPMLRTNPRSNPFDFFSKKPQAKYAVTKRYDENSKPHLDEVVELNADELHEYLQEVGLTGDDAYAVERQLKASGKGSARTGGDKMYGNIVTAVRLNPAKRR